MHLGLILIIFQQLDGVCGIKSEQSTLLLIKKKKKKGCVFISFGASMDQRAQKIQYMIIGIHRL